MMVAEREMVDFAIEDRQARNTVKDLHTPRPAFYWTDLALTAGAGWAAFVATVLLPFGATPLLCGAAAVFALYRGLCFMHEISHINRSSLRGFDVVWNALFGAPLLMPSLVYVGVHQSHHSLSTYGTSQDPEYLPFASSRGMTIFFALESFFIPLALVVRFLVLAPAGFLLPPFERWLASRFSALTMNLQYTREATPELLRRIRWQSAAILALWGTALVLLPLKAFIVWFAVVSSISFINTLRTLAAHRYEGDGHALDRNGQLLDSVDVPGRFWTELWAPVGLRYHALHHYFPGIPYHNLPEAHRRLVATLPAHSAYRGVSSPGLVTTLRTLILR